MSPHRLRSSLFLIAIGLVCSAGCDEAPPPRPVAKPEPAPVQQPAPAQPAAAQPQRQSIIGKTTAVVVDSNKALAENPNLIVVENRKLGEAYLQQVGNAYVTIRSQASTLGMTRAIQLYQAEHGRNPDFDSFVRMMQENGIEFTELYRWQKYGYDSKKGEIQVLEDKAEKKRIYEEAGLEFTE